MEFCTENHLDTHSPILALLAGSRLQEIKDNLPAMIEVAERFEDFQMVLAGAPSIEDKYYEQFLKGTPVKMVRNKTYPLLVSLYGCFGNEWYGYVGNCAVRGAAGGLLRDSIASSCSLCV